MASQDKLFALAQKFLDLQEQNKRYQARDKDIEKATALIIKQRDQAQSEISKHVLIKSKLESLCRELQKQNKQIKDENLQRIKDEEEKRKEITTKFQSAIDEINQQVTNNAEKNQGLISENAQLATKLKTLLEQYEIKEQHTEKIIKHKDLEIQLANAKFQQAELKCTQMTECNKQEKSLYETHISELMKRIEFHKDSETQLRSQLSVYTQKYEEFQTTLTKSNDVFASFRTEMDKMTKKMKKLESEVVQWRNKYDSSNKSLLSMTEHKDNLEKEVKKCQTKADTMEQLSRTLQTERTNLMARLKLAQTAANSETASLVPSTTAAGSSIVVVPASSTSPQPPSASSTETQKPVDSTQVKLEGLSEATNIITEDEKPSDNTQASN